MLRIKCSGAQPCVTCQKRNLNCLFDTKQNKVLVSQRYLAELERRVANLPIDGSGTTNDLDMGADDDFSDDDNDLSTLQEVPGTVGRDDAISESGNSPRHALRATPESDLRNPLDPTISNAFTVDTGRKHFFL